MAMFHKNVTQEKKRISNHRNSPAVSLVQINRIPNKCSGRDSNMSKDRFVISSQNDDNDVLNRI